MARGGHFQCCVGVDEACMYVLLSIALTLTKRVGGIPLHDKGGEAVADYMSCTSMGRGMQKMPRVDG